MTPAERLDATFGALADGTRRAILARLAQGEASVAELAEPFGMTRAAVSKHLMVLERAGLVSTARDAQRRPRSLHAAPLSEATTWLNQYRAFWEGSYARLDALLEEQKLAPSTSTETRTKYCTMTPSEFQLETPSDDVIVHRRVFAAPPASVFDALTQPYLIRRWYGPPGWTCTDCTMDLRVGGPWRIVTRKPDGNEIIQSGQSSGRGAPTLREDGAVGGLGRRGDIVVTTELVDQHGVTLLIVTTRFPSKDVRDCLLASGAAQHAREHYDKLATLLAGAP